MRDPKNQQEVREYRFNLKIMPLDLLCDELTKIAAEGEGFGWKWDMTKGEIAYRNEMKARECEDYSKWTLAQLVKGLRDNLNAGRTEAVNYIFNELTERATGI